MGGKSALIYIFLNAVCGQLKGEIKKNKGKESKNEGK